MIFIAPEGQLEIFMEESWMLATIVEIFGILEQLKLSNLVFSQFISHTLSCLI